MRTLAARFPAALIANSETTRGTLGVAANRATVTGYPLDVPPELPARSSGGEFRAGLVGRIAPWKGQRLFLEAFARAFPDGSERAILVGAPMFGEDSYEAELRACAGDLGLQRRVEFRGFREDAWQELAGLDVLVHASLIPEPFGQVVTEAMAAGIPVIAADAGGPAELIRHGVNGVLYPRGNAEALAKALRRLSNDPAERARLAGEARSVRTRFAPEVVAASVMSVYRDVMEGAH